MGQKRVFQRVIVDQLGRLNKCFLARFEPAVTRLGPWKIPKCLEKGPFWDQERVKNGSKTRFSKSDRGPFRMLKQMFLARFEPMVTCFGPWKIPKCLEKGPFWDQKKGLKMGQKRVFLKVIVDHLGCSNKCF